MINIDCVQQLKPYERGRMKYPMFGQVKMDGIFGRWNPVKKCFHTRAGNVIQGLAVLEGELAHIDFPLDGELVLPNTDFFTMNGLLRSFNETPTCRYYIFDAPDDMPYRNRVDKYMSIAGPHLTTMKVHVLESHIDTTRFYDKVIAAGHEGTVYKQPRAMYVDGKCWDNMKDVPIKTCECTILSAYEGLGKLEGKLGGFVVDFKGHKVKVGGGPGLDYNARELAWADRDKYIGTSLKCQYKSLTPSGSMRSPQMLGLRWDI